MKTKEIKISKEVRDAINREKKEGEDDDDVIMRILKEKGYNHGDVHQAIHIITGGMQLLKMCLDKEKQKEYFEAEKIYIESFNKMWEGIMEDLGDKQQNENENQRNRNQ